MKQTKNNKADAIDASAFIVFLRAAKLCFYNKAASDDEYRQYAEQQRKPSVIRDRYGGTKHKQDG